MESIFFHFSLEISEERKKKSRARWGPNKSHHHFDVFVDRLHTTVCYAKCWLVSATRTVKMISWGLVRALAISMRIAKTNSAHSLIYWIFRILPCDELKRIMYQLRDFGIWMDYWNFCFQVLAIWRPLSILRVVEMYLWVEYMNDTIRTDVTTEALAVSKTRNVTGALYFEWVVVSVYCGL